MKNLSTVNTQQKEVSSTKIFTNNSATVTVLTIAKNGILKEHTSPIDALLLCIEGNVVFENELQEKFELKQGDFIDIQHNIKHWVVGLENSTLLLCR